MSGIPEDVRYVFDKLPPSVNGLFVEIDAGQQWHENGGKLSSRPIRKRIKVAAYKAWREEAGWAIKRQVRKSITGEVALLIECVKPDNRKRDVSNLIKAVEDLLVEMQVIEDDSMVMDVRARWVSAGDPCVVTVTQIGTATLS